MMRFSHHLLKSIRANAENLESPLGLLYDGFGLLYDGEIYSDFCDVSLIRYADDVLLISLGRFTLQANLDSLISGYNLLDINFNALKTEFPTHNARDLGLVYGPDKHSTHILTIEHAILGFRASYAKLAALKCSYSNSQLLKSYSC
ncbi:hypothetical protein QYM36_005052 [Artemia franciscana]|uniref:Reverse transcriptase domain-containing protein n=1 Tax=Artemia franciscana TaxID=6661 RepID=A0AA88IEL3_ARTSF|nr:hypothetical protein QYM36_005052 [Artemia franciscana]